MQSNLIVKESESMFIPDDGKGGIGESRGRVAKHMKK